MIKPSTVTVVPSSRGAPHAVIARDHAQAQRIDANIKAQSRARSLSLSSSPVTDETVISTAEIDSDVIRSGSISSSANDTNAVFRATQNNDTELLQKLLEHLPDVDVIRSDGWTLLHCAAFFNAIEAIELLLKHGADVNIANDNFGDIALHLATRNGYVDAVQVLLHSGSGIDVRTRHGCTALLIATQRRYSLLVNLLLEQGASTDIADKKGDTPLACATRRGYHEIVEELLRHKAIVVTIPDEPGGNTVLHSTVKDSTVLQEDLVKIWTSTGASFGSNQQTPKEYSEVSSPSPRIKMYHPTPADIIDISRLFARKGLPVKLTDLILEQAEYWARITTTFNTSSGKDYTAVGGRCEDVLVLRSKPICSAAADGAFNKPSTVQEPRDRHPVRRITWTIAAHDQGWSDVIGDTYEQSWTGFRGNVLRYVPPGMSLSQGAWPQHSDRSSETNFWQLSSQEYLSAWDEIQEPGMRPKKETLGQYIEGTSDELRVWPHGPWGFEKTKVQLNQRAATRTTEHVVIWDARDFITSEDPKAIDELVKKGRGIDTGSGKQVRALCRGDVVELHSFAFFSGWVNHLKSAQLVIEFAM